MSKVTQKVTVIIKSCSEVDMICLNLRVTSFSDDVRFFGSRSCEDMFITFLLELQIFSGPIVILRKNFRSNIFDVAPV